MDTYDDNTLLRRCTKCKNQFPATLEFFTKEGKGLRSVCRSCSKVISKKWRQEHPDERRQYKERYRKEHIEQEREAARRYRHEHSAKIKQYRQTYNHTYYERYGEQIRSRVRQWRIDHLEEERERTKSYRKNNAAKVRINKQLYHQNHKEECRVYSHRRRIHKLDNGGIHTIDDIRLQFKSQRGRCWHCGKKLKGDKYHIDHLIPLSRGGTNAPENIVISCPKCNLSKGAKLTQEWNGKLF